MVQIHGATAFAGVCHLVLAGLIILNVKTAYTLVGWWTLGDLNPRPSGCKPDALPTELSALVS